MMHIDECLICQEIARAVLEAELGVPITREQAALIHAWRMRVRSTREVAK